MIRRAALLLLPAALAAQGVQGPQAFRMDSGLECVLVENHGLPLIRMELVSRWDRSELPAGKEGIAGFLAEVTDAGGAGAYNRAAFNRAVDALGMRFTFTPRMGSFRWTVAADSRTQEQAMELLVDAVVRPAFDGPLAESERKDLLKRAGAGTLRERGLARFLWGLGDPRVLAPPAAAGLDNIEFQDLLDFRRRVLRPEHSRLMLYGDLNLAQAKQLVLMHLGIWGPGAQPPVKGSPRPAARPAPEPRLLAVFAPGPGAELWAGAVRLGPARPGVEALLPILLTRASRALFGGFEMTFRLPPEGGTPLVIQAKVAQADRDTLVPGFMAGLQRLRETGFTPEDLACALIQWKAENVALPLHPEALLRESLDGRLEPGLALAVEQVTLKDLDLALKAWLAPERLRFLLVGADAPMLQAAEQAGLKPSLVLSPDA